MIDQSRTEKKPVFTVASEESGQRIDNLLLKKYKQVQRPQWYKLLRKGQVRVNGKRVKPLHKLMAGDQVRIPPGIFFADPDEPIRPPAHEVERISHNLLLETENFVVLDKPAGLACHAGSGVPYGVVELMQHTGRWSYIQLCHRLDRLTSGCLVLARNRQSLADFQRQLKAHQVEKHYVAVLNGLLGEARVVDEPLDTQHRVKGIRTVRVSADGKSAKTFFEPLLAQQKASLVRCRIESGRTHQIRVHSAQIGHPVVGDLQYGAGGQAQAGGGRQLYLHAHSLKFLDGQDTIEVEAPIPQQFSHYVDL